MNRRMIAPFVFVAAAVVACAGDPHKEVRSAETELNQSQMQSENKPSEVQEKNLDRQAGTSRANQTARTEAKRDAQREVIEAKANLEEARIKMQRDRDRFNIDGKARFDKLDAKASEAKAKSSRLYGKRNADFQAAWKSYISARDEAAMKLRALPNVSDATWATDRDSTDMALSNFEKAVDTLTSRL